MEVTQAQFLALLRKEWEPGDDIAVFGPKGVGKTYLLADILELRKYAVLISAKFKDRTITERYSNYRVIEDWKERHVWDRKVVLWPRPQHLRDAKIMGPAIYRCLDAIYLSGGWAVVLDDVRFLDDSLGLGDDINNFISLVRSHDTSVVSMMQRPFDVPQMCIDQPEFWIMFHTSDDRSLDRIAKASGVDLKALRVSNSQLGEYDVLLVRRFKEPLIVRR